MNHGDIQTSERVRDALAEGRPVVALETAVITHGMPRAPLPTPTCFAEARELLVVCAMLPKTAAGTAPQGF